MTDLAAMLIAFTNNITSSAWGLLWALGALFGVVLLGLIISRFASANSGVPGANHVGLFEVFGLAIVSVFLFNFATSLNMIVQTGGLEEATFGAVSYSGAEGMGELTAVVNAALTLATIAGGIFSFKGWIGLLKAFKPGGGDHVYSSVTHILFGGALVVIPQLIEIFGASLGLAWS
ncbi:TPA: conjugal transfer protein TraQ [Klebsiella aerogenes]